MPIIRSLILSWRTENYKDGKSHGLREEYFVNGQLEKKENYKNGKKDGLWEEFDENGNLIKTEEYKDGKLIE